MKGDLTPQTVNDVLERNNFGHLACSVDGKPYVFPMAYGYFEGALYGQTSVGKKIDVLRSNPKVCFQVEEVSDDHWNSVMCWGTFEELNFAELQGEEAMQLAKVLTERLGNLQEHFGVQVDFEYDKETAYPLPTQTSSTLFRIVTTEKTGRYCTRA